MSSRQPVSRRTFATLAELEAYASEQNKKMIVDVDGLTALKSLDPRLVMRVKYRSGPWIASSPTCPLVAVVIANGRVKAVAMDCITCLRVYINNKGFPIPK
jgi:hypothetical protein